MNEKKRITFLSLSWGMMNEKKRITFLSLSWGMIGIIWGES
jgi:hypothetical protein